MAIDFKQNEDLFSLKVDDTAKALFLETMRWTKFVGVIFAILVALVSLIVTFVFTFYMPVYMQTTVPNSSILLLFTLLIMVGTNFYPIFALLKFSSLIKRAVNTGNQQEFNAALKYMKNLFKYIGFFTITFIVMYGLGIGATLLQARP